MISKSTKTKRELLVYTSPRGKKVDKFKIGGRTFVKRVSQPGEWLQIANPSCVLRIIPDPITLIYRYDQPSKIFNLVEKPVGFTFLPTILQISNSKTVNETAVAAKYITGRYEGRKWNRITFLLRGKGGKTPWFYGYDINSGSKSLLLFIKPDLKGDLKILYFRGFFPQSPDEWKRIQGRFLSTTQKKLCFDKPVKSQNGSKR